MRVFRMVCAKRGGKKYTEVFGDGGEEKERQGGQGKKPSRKTCETCRPNKHFLFTGVDDLVILVPVG